MTFLQAPGGWGKPDTLLIRTQQGGCGVLQILGSTDTRGVKIRYKLVQDAGKTEEKPANDAELANQPPQLRALDWQDRVDVGAGESWLPSGELLASPAWLPPITRVDISETKAAKEQPRFLCLWFSHPLFDAQSVAEVTLLDADGKRPLETPTDNRAVGKIAASPENANTGWITATVCAGKMLQIPQLATMSLRYSVGAWQFWDDIAPDFHGTQALANGVMLSDPGQNSAGHAFVQIARDSSADTGVEQFDFVATTRDGRRLERNGHSQSGSGRVSTERFFFDTPLSQVKSFECRKRPIHVFTSMIALKPDADAKMDPASPAETAAVVAAEAWLAGIDAGNFAQSWKDAAALFQAAITEAGWNAAVTGVRKPLGALVSRKLKSAQYTKSLPGAPDGEYVFMQFDTSFAAKKTAVETVTFMLEKDGSWRAAGYFIK
jgi:hypothetical protein